MVGTLVAGARDRIAAFGDVEPHAAYGHPAEELAVYSASLDLLVVGSRVWPDRSPELRKHLAGARADGPLPAPGAAASRRRD